VRRASRTEVVVAHDVAALGKPKWRRRRSAVARCERKVADPAADELPEVEDPRRRCEGSHRRVRSQAQSTEYRSNTQRFSEAYSYKVSGEVRYISQIQLQAEEEEEKDG
jgi:hypothetical protein